MQQPTSSILLRFGAATRVALAPSDSNLLCVLALLPNQSLLRVEAIHTKHVIAPIATAALAHVNTNLG